MARVFVVQDLGDKDITPALQFGDITVLGSHDYPIFGDPTPVRNAFAAKLKDFNPLEDSVLPVGDPVLIGLTFALLAKTNSQIKVLKYDRRKRQYWPMTINV